MWTSLSVLALGLVASVAAGVVSPPSKRSLKGAESVLHHSLPLEGEHHIEHHEEHYEEPKPYKFGYGVKDVHQGLDFNQQEASDGHTVSGHYRVQLPDGRTQVVHYTADWKNGYNADVQYEGEASHPKVIAASSGGHGHPWSSGASTDEAVLGGGSSSDYYSSGGEEHSSKWTPSSHP